MNIYLNITLGLIKIFFLFSLVFLGIKKYVLLKRDFTFIFDAIIRKYFEYFSLLILVLFATIYTGFYDGIVVSIIMAMIVLGDYLKVTNPYYFVSKFKERFKFRLIDLVKNLEKNQFSIKSIFTGYFNSKNRKNIYILYSIAFLLGLIILISFYFIRYDHYLFSPSWFEVLEMINAKDDQKWFTTSIKSEGIYAFINYISHVTNSSPEITIYIYSVFQLLIVVFFIFWIVVKITKSQIIIPVFVSLFYILGFTYLPVNITNFYQSSSMHLAFTLVFPIMIYTMNPESLPYSKWERFVRFLIAFLALGLLDFYILFFVLPFFFVINSIIYISKTNLSRLILIGVYLLSIIVLLLMYSHFLEGFSESIFVFFKRNLIAVELYFYNPHMSISVDRLLFYYQIIFISGFFVNILFAILFFKKWKKRMVFFLFTLVIYLLTQINYIWIDNDLLLRMLSILIPIQTGIVISIFFDLFKIIFKKEYYKSYRVIVVVVVTVLIFGTLQRKQISIEKEEYEVLNEEVLSANEKILRNYLDRSYMVVNKEEFSNLSSGNRFFMNYKEFMNKRYLKQDNLYAKYIGNNKYLQKHPTIVMPSSVLVFVYDEKFSKDVERKWLLNRISYLESIGRPVREIYQSKYLKVFEIINKPNSSYVTEMVF
jgi:hypothetical protein